MFKDKGLLIGIVVTVVLIAGGIFFFTKGSPATTTSTGKTVSTDILVPKDDYKTAGIKDGKYLDATSSATVTLVEFGDYECPACGQYHPLVKQLLTDLAGKITYVYRNYPLSQHANAPISSQAAEAAGLQGKFWQMHDKLYESQPEWSNATDPTSIFVGYAQALGLNVDQFKTDLTSQKVKDKVQSDKNDGNLVQLTGTPSFFINGKAVDTLPASYNDFKNLVSSQISQ